ncbi:HTH-type transcriptional repressor NagR (plasmid) [Asticcacaulis sp. MM231]
MSSSAPLPTERDLADRYGISRMTVRRALSDLQRKGLLTRRQGAGTYVTARALTQSPGLKGLREDMAVSAASTHSIVTERSIDAVTPQDALALDLGPGARVYRFQRVRYVGLSPVATEISLVPWYCLPSEHTVEESLYSALRKAGNAPSRTLQRLRAIALATAEASLLKVAAGTPGLFIERHSYLRDGRTAELTRAWYRGDASDVIAEISLTEDGTHLSHDHAAPRLYT